ncbi:hypothetical protein [Streptomyces sp. NPDC047097]|uniref:hypothetical protein n=1 Tax=Streptomyces sp. NPDC047097 TaxID=3155260 RepID=UPI0033E6CE19
MTQPSTVRFDGTHASVLAVMHLVDAGRSTTVIDIHADTDPTRSHITIPTPDGRVRIHSGDSITRGPGGTYLVTPAARPA